MSVSSSAQRERNRITRTIQCYVDGGKSGSGDKMREAFHPDATIFGYVRADLFAGPIEMLFDWVDQNGAATELQSRIAAIDVGTNSIHMVIVEQQRHGYRVIDKEKDMVQLGRGSLEGRPLTDWKLPAEPFTTMAK